MGTLPVWNIPIYWDIEPNKPIYYPHSIHHPNRANRSHMIASMFLPELGSLDLSSPGYNCIYFAAIRNDVEAEGESNPVFEWKKRRKKMHAAMFERDKFNPCHPISRSKITINKPYPIGSMYGIYTNIGGILMVNVTIYSIHGSYGYFACLSPIFWMCLRLKLFSKGWPRCPTMFLPKKSWNGWSAWCFGTWLLWLSIYIYI